MEFKKENVYTALNATEDLIGAKGYFAQSIDDLRYFVGENCGKINEVISLDNDFMVQAYDNYNFFYLVEPAEEKYVVVKFNDYSVGLKRDLSEEGKKHILFEGTKEECEYWIEKQSESKYRPFKNCDELIGYYVGKRDGLLGYDSGYSLKASSFELPTIWVMNKSITSEKHSITDYDYRLDLVYIHGWDNLDEFFNNYIFLDGSPCGMKIKE